MKPPTYHDRERAVLNAVHSIEFRKRAGQGGTATTIVRPLDIWDDGKPMSPKDVWQEVADTLKAPAWRNQGIAVYAVATINGETHYASLSLADGHNPWE